MKSPAAPASARRMSCLRHSAASGGSRSVGASPSCTKSRHRAAGELQADHRGRLHDPALGRPQAVEAGTQQGRDVPRDRDGLGGAGEDPAPRLLTQEPVVDQHGEHLLDEQRVAFGEAEDALLERLGQARLAEEVPHHQAALLSGELPELDLGGRRSPRREARPVLVELVAGRTDKEERHAERGVEDVLDEVEEGCLRPVDVVEDDHERPTAGQLPRVARTAQNSSSFPYGCCERPMPDSMRLVASAMPRTEAGCELVAGVLLAVLRHDPGRLPQHLGQRPERDAVAVGQAAAPQHRRLAGDAPHELLDEPALADPGMAEQRDEPALGSGDRTAELRAEGGDLARPADERQVRRSGRSSRRR